MRRAGVQATAFNASLSSSALIYWHVAAEASDGSLAWSSIASVDAIGGSASELSPKNGTSPSAGGATYYVSPGGSDAADGRSPATAWRSFAHVSAGQVPAGSVILAQAGGVWSEAVRARAADLRFGVYGDGPRPRIIAPAGQMAFNGWYYPGLRLSGWEFTAATRQADPTYGLVFLGGDGHVVDDIVVHGVDGILFTSRGEAALNQNSEFYDAGFGSGAVSAVSIGGYEGDGAPDPARATIFRANYLHDTAYRALETWGGNLRIENNRFERWTTAGLAGSGTLAPAGIYVASRYPGLVSVTGNRLVGSGAEYRGIWVDYGPERQTVIEANTIQAAASCAFVEATANVVFQRNTCDHTGAGVRWGGNGENPSVNGSILSNTFIGPAPTEGWIVVNPGSTASISGNVYQP
jgi:hypothetical protein